MRDSVKKALVIAYHFPPLGWSGVQRTLKFVKYLPDFNWEPLVVTVGKNRFFVSDETLGEDVPQNISVVRIDDIVLKNITNQIMNDLIKYVHPSFDIVGDDLLKQEYMSILNEYMAKIRNTLFFPDDAAAWANTVIQQVGNLVNMNDISIIYTTGRPWSTHIIGYKLKRKFHISWVADFRDEWTNNAYDEYDKKSLCYKMEYALENEIVHYADKIITTSVISSENYRKIFDLPYEKVHTITNGYDEEDFKNINKETSEKFTIIHNGALYSVRTPNNFLKALDNLIRQGKIDETKLSVKFIGTCEKQIREEIEETPMNRFITWVPYLPHKESIKETANADLLLLISGVTEKVRAMIPGKTFEYLRMNIPILSISPKDSAVERIILETKRGFNVEYDDISAMEKVILENYNRWTRKFEINWDNEAIKKYERKNLTKTLADIFNATINE